VYLFSHDKIRDIVYTDAGDARRRVAHARAIDALRGVGAPATELAFHALAAGRLGDAYRFSVAAGDDALRVFAMRDAIGQYATAERVVLDHPALMTEAGTPADGNDARVADLFSQLLLQMGRAYEVVNERDEAQRTYQRLLEHARTWSQPTMECLALNRMATLIGQTGAGVERATPLLLEARRIAEAAGDRRGLAETEWNLAQSGVYISDPAVASDHGARALALARELGDRDLVARSLNVLAYASWDLGQWERCDTYAGEAADLYGALGNRPLEVDSLALAAESKARVGRLHEGIVAARRALAGSEEIENPWGQVTSAYHLAPCLVDAGLYAEALAVATRGTAIAHAQGIPPLLVFSLVELGAARRALLDLDGAVAAHSEALALSATLQPIFRETSAAALCADYALAGRWHNAYEAGRLAAETRNPALLHTAFSRWLETEALIRGGEWERAQRDVARLGEQLGENRRLRIPYLRCQAVMDAAAGRPAAACRHLKEAADLARALALPGELWSIERACAALYLTLGDRHAAAAADSRAAVALQILAANVGDEAARAAFLNAATRLGGLSVKPA
jgi:tetratricopeptide (TPR) repeat protein